MNKPQSAYNTWYMNIGTSMEQIEGLKNNGKHVTAIAFAIQRKNVLLFFLTFSCEPNKFF